MSPKQNPMPQFVGESKKTPIPLPLPLASKNCALIELPLPISESVCIWSGVAWISKFISWPLSPTAVQSVMYICLLNAYWYPHRKDDLKSIDFKQVFSDLRSIKYEQYLAIQFC